MSKDHELAHLLKIRFGTAPNEPASDQVLKIKLEIQILVAQGETLSYTDWYTIVHKYCPSAGTHKYAGADNSDLTTLLLLATKK